MFVFVLLYVFINFSFEHWTVWETAPIQHMDSVCNAFCCSNHMTKWLKLDWIRKDISGVFMRMKAVDWQLFLWMLRSLHIAWSDCLFWKIYTM